MPSLFRARTCISGRATRSGRDEENFFTHVKGSGASIAAMEKEKVKSDKYHNVSNIMGFAIETLGGIGCNFKEILHKISKRAALQFLVII